MLLIIEVRYKIFHFKLRFTDNVMKVKNVYDVTLL